MKEIKQKVAIDQPAQKVFGFTINPANTPKWIDSIIKEQASESPAKLGTVFKNQDRNGNWSGYEITAYQQNVMFVMSKRNGDYHVKYKLKPLANNRCELEYSVWVDTGSLNERFTQDMLHNLLQKLKDTIERSTDRDM
jgi:hypothetical protein